MYCSKGKTVNGYTLERQVVVYYSLVSLDGSRAWQFPQSKIGLCEGTARCFWSHPLGTDIGTDETDPTLGLTAKFSLPGMA